LFIDLNCDMGELEDAAIEEALMPHITSANVACGAHAGSDEMMARTVRLALRHGVSVGAHPGYPDRANFGRVEMPLTFAEIAETVFAQIARLEKTGAALAHVKPHGALYNVAAKKPEVAAAIAEGVARWNPATVLVGLAGSKALDVWRERGFQVAAEAFADRRYEADGSLRSRQFDDALITDPAEAAEQAVRLVRQGRAQTLCIHSDTPGSVRTVAAVACALRDAGITLKPLAAALPPTTF
jgi:5-oxoprolinase (ATP-hydrolysing) subunit A